MRSIDDELRHRFAELRETDSAMMPDFAVMQAAARANRPRTRRTGWLLAAAAAAAVAGVAAGVQWKVRPIPTNPALTISRWTSPTASLLQLSVVGITAPPSALGSVLDELSPTETGK
jgi:hypothetical protein